MSWQLRGWPPQWACDYRKFAGVPEHQQSQATGRNRAMATGPSNVRRRATSRSRTLGAAPGGPRVTKIGRARWVGDGTGGYGFEQPIYGSGLANMRSAHVGASFDPEWAAAYNSPTGGNDNMMVVRGGGAYPYNHTPMPISLSGNQRLFLAHSVGDGGDNWSFSANQIG